MKEIWTTPTRNSTSNGTGQVYNPYVIDTPELWDSIFQSSPTGSIIHLGMGEYKTYGFALNDLVPGGQVEFKTGWNIIGSGRDKTIVKLIPRPSLPRYVNCGHAIFGTYYNTPLKNVVIDGMTFDLDMAAQASASFSGSGRAFNAVNFATVQDSIIKNVRVIRWGTDSDIIEGFPMAIFRGDYSGFPYSTRNVMENIIVERPVRVAKGGYTAIALVSDHSVVRNCRVDGIFDNGTIRSCGNGICPWGHMTSMHDNVIRYVLMGGPYCDTGGIFDCTAYNNIYEFVLVACYINYNNSTSVQTGDIVFRNNYIELGKTADYPWPVLAVGSWSDNPAQDGLFQGQSLEVSNNIIKLHPSFKSSDTGAALYVTRMKNVRVTNNVYYLQPNYKAFTTVNCGQVIYSGNFNYKPKV